VPLAVTGSAATGRLLNGPGRRTERLLADSPDHVPPSFPAGSLRGRPGGAAVAIAVGPACPGPDPPVVATSTPQPDGAGVNGAIDGAVNHLFRNAHEQVPLLGRTGRSEHTVTEPVETWSTMEAERRAHASTAQAGRPHTYRPPAWPGSPAPRAPGRHSAPASSPPRGGRASPQRPGPAAHRWPQPRRAWTQGHPADLSSLAERSPAVTVPTSPERRSAAPAS
jgi:hypothetical protein